MKYAVITGASSGIGAELAKEFSARGYGTILVARRTDRLQQLASELKTPTEIITADLTNPTDIEDLEHRLKKFEVGVFVNNAGFGDCGPFTEGDLGKELRMIDLNVKALHQLSKIALSLMAKEGGYLLNVGSSAGLMSSGPYMATYYATKAYVVSLTQGMAHELRQAKSKVSASVLCPGPVDTEFNEVAGVKFALPGISAKYCARYAVRQMFKRQIVIVPSLTMKAGVILSKFLPRNLVSRIAGFQQKKKIANAK